MIGRTKSEGRHLGSDRAVDPQNATRKGWGKVLAALALLTSFGGLIDGVSAGLMSAAPIRPAAFALGTSSTQFDITGFPQTAILDPSCSAAGAANNNCGGTVTINGHTITIPKETIVIMPASAITWKELWTLAPQPYNGTAYTGMALNDVPKPKTTYEFHVVGNRVVDPTKPAGSQDLYIAGLVHVSQSELNGGAGYINYMDYSNGEMRVGGLIGDLNCSPGGAGGAAGGPTCSGARVQINDPFVNVGDNLPPSGRYSRGYDNSTPSAIAATAQDPRFQVDQDNPTILAGNGYPMCFPRVTADPTVAGNADDPKCPQSNRPLDATGVPSISFAMNNPNLIIGGPLDPTKQAPMEVGDYITFSGGLNSDNNGPGGASSDFVSAHTIVNNAAIYTSPGTNPAYVSIEVALMGTGGTTALGVAEAAIRTRFEGMTTDPTRSIRLYGVDVDQFGNITDRDWGTIDPDPGPIVGAVKGRWRFRPPCATFGSIVAKPDKQCTNGPDNMFVPATREVRAVIDGVLTAEANNGVVGGGAPFGAGWPEPPKGTQIVLGTTPATAPVANGIFAGQYHAPIGEFIFPENVPGTPIVENNFQSMPFLAHGGYSTNSGFIAGQLNPWPGLVAPTVACPLETANAGGPYTVASGGTITLSGSSTPAASLTAYQWASIGGVANGTLSPLTASNPTYTAPVLAPGAPSLTVPLSLVVNNSCGASVAATSSITVVAPTPLPPSVNPPLVALSITSGANGIFTVSGSDPNSPASPLTFAVTEVAQAGSPFFTLGVPTPLSSTSASVTIAAKAGVLAPTVVNVTITATNSLAIPLSSSITVPITIVPVVVAPPAKDVVTVNSALYRQNKQRLIVTATSSDPAAILSVAPYLTTQGKIFDPVILGNTLTLVNGVLSVTMVGAPQPAAGTAGGAGIVVKSTKGGVSAPFAISVRAN